MLLQTAFYTYSTALILTQENVKPLVPLAFFQKNLELKYNWSTHSILQLRPFKLTNKQRLCASNEFARVNLGLGKTMANKLGLQCLLSSKASVNTVIEP